MRVRPNRGIFCVLSLVGLIVVAVGCADDDGPKKPVGKALAVAELSKKEGSVDYRAAKTLTWSPAKQQMALYHRDALKTGKGASSKVKFKTGAELEIEELSLVVIEAQPEAAPDPKGPAPKKKPADVPAPQVARLEQGTLRGVVKPGAPAVKVVTADGRTTEIKAQGSEPVPFRIRARKGKLEVAVLKGSATVSSGGRSVVLKPRQVVDVSAKAISKPVELLPYPELEAPPVDAKVAAGSEMELRWNAVAGAAMYRVQVSHQVSFGERLHDTTVVGASFKLPAPKSKRTYVWRVNTVDGSGRESEFGFARRFHVETATRTELPGQLLSPMQNAGIQYVGKPRPVTFSWKGEGKPFTFVVARHASLTKMVVVRRRTKRTSVRLRTLGRGVYFWGVYVGKDRQPLFDKPHKLIIAQRHPPYVRVPKAIDWK
jgi:hypothetical protein